MLRYVGTKLAIWIPSVLLVMLAVYALAFFGAGDPIKLIFLRAPGDVAYNPARIAAIRRQPGGSATVRATVERLVTVLEQTDRGGELAFTLDIPANLQLAVLPDDLSEILGAVLENAVRYARRQVRIQAEAGPGWTRVAIEDDGPGIDTDQAKAALARGGRLDEAQGGSGLGLAIARELAEVTGGAIGMSRSALGGLQVFFTSSDTYAFKCSDELRLVRQTSLPALVALRAPVVGYAT